MCHLNYYRRVQIVVMCCCFACYVLSNVYLVWFYEIDKYILLSKRCRLDVQGFAEIMGLKNVLASNLSPKCPCLNKTCVPKCCQLNQQFFSGQGMYCADSLSSRPFSQEIADNLTIYHSTRISRTKIGNLMPKKVIASDIHVFEGRQICERIKPHEIHNFEKLLFEDGTAVTGYRTEEKFRPKTLKDLDEYCVEKIDNEVVVLTAENCVENKASDKIKAKDYTKLYKNCYVDDVVKHISCILVFLTVFVYIYSPELRNHRGKVLVGYLATLGVYKLISIIVNSYHCYQLNVLSHILFITYNSQYFWLTCMSFDLWSVFSRPFRKSRDILQGNWKLIVYCFYSWALPAIDSQLQEYHLRSIERKMLRDPMCYELPIKEDFCRLRFHRALILRDLPLYLQAGLNSVMFLSTLLNLRLHFINSAVLASADSNRHSQMREHFRTYVKLAIVMGLPYSLSFFARETDRGVLKLILEISRDVCPISLCVVLLADKKVTEMLGKIRSQQITL